MADDGEPYEPLWSEGLRREPGPGPDEPARLKAPSLTARSALAIAAVVALAALLGVILSDRSGRVTVANLESFWGDVEMRCTTVRTEGDGRTDELFRCRAQGAGELPAGTYQPPDTNWSSDFDRRPAEDYAIRISASGEVVGWALYVP